VRSPFLWRHLALLAGLVANGVLSGVSLVKGHTAVRAWALPLGIAVRAATFVYLLLSLFAVLLGLEVFTALEWEYDWRPHDAWPQIQPGMTRRQVVALLGPPQSHIRFEYGYLLWPLAYSQGTLTADNYGRDHHPRCFTLWLAGGGIRPGITYGKTDDFSYNIVENPVEVHDMHATMLHLLGLDHTKLTYRFNGRDMRLTDVYGTLIPQIANNT